MSRALKSIVVIVFVAMLASPLFAEAARGTYIITADVPLRGGPGADQEVITVLPRGIQVNVVGKEGYWLRIESKHGGRPGYIDEQFARPTTPQASTAPARDYGVSVAGPYRTLREVALREGPGTKYPVVARIHSMSESTSRAPKATGYESNPAEAANPDMSIKATSSACLNGKSRAKP